MKQEKSCGAVIYRERHGEPEILLICSKSGGHWTFPKGHVETGETEEETALREIREETNLKVKLDTAFRRVVRYSPKPEVMKDVVFFAAKYEDGEPKAQPEEVLAIEWLSPACAAERITFASDRDTLNGFLEYQKRAVHAANQDDSI